jgi:hypothetical protein
MKNLPPAPFFSRVKIQPDVKFPCNWQVAHNTIAIGTSLMGEFTLDVKVLDENLGGILGGTQC